MPEKRVAFPLGALLFLIPIAFYIIGLPETGGLNAFSIGFYLTLNVYMMFVMFAKNLGIPLLAGTKCFIVSSLLRLIDGGLHVLGNDSSTYLDLILNITGNALFLVGTIVLYRVVSNCVAFISRDPLDRASISPHALRSGILPTIIIVLALIISVIHDIDFTSTVWIAELIGYLFAAVIYFLPWFFLCKWVRDPYVYNTPVLYATVRKQTSQNQEAET